MGMRVFHLHRCTCVITEQLLRSGMRVYSRTSFAEIQYAGRRSRICNRVPYDCLLFRTRTIRVSSSISIMARDSDGCKPGSEKREARSQ